MLDNPTDLVEDASRLTSVFGYWPSFHDAEVLQVSLDRSGPDGPSLEAKIHVFGVTNPSGPTGHSVLKNHILATLRFSGIALKRLEQFNGQNVLFDLEMTAIDPAKSDGRKIAVNMSSSYGLAAAFECTSCTVADVQPFDPAS